MRREEKRLVAVAGPSPGGETIVMKNRDLGMNRPITRRDFVGGVAVAISGSMAWRWSEAGAPTASYEQRRVHVNPYPPIRTGMRGSHEGSYEVAHQLRDGVAGTVRRNPANSTTSSSSAEG